MKKLIKRIIKPIVLEILDEYLKSKMAQIIKDEIINDLQDFQF